MDIFGNFSPLKGDRHRRKSEAEPAAEFSYADVTLESVARIESKASLPSLFRAKLLFSLFFAVLVTCLFYQQIVKGMENLKLAEGNRIRPRLIEASRGLITDRNGVWLARNQADFALSLYPSDLPSQREERNQIFQQLSQIAGLSFDEVARMANEKSRYFLDAITIKDHISHDEALLLEEKVQGLPGIFIALRSSREYVALPGVAHLLGYTGSVAPEDVEKGAEYYMTDRIGKVGLEKVYEEDLRGVHGVEQIEVDSKGKIVRVLVKEGNREAEPGADLSLYLDRDLQNKAGELLRGGMEKAKELTGNEITAGTAIMMDVNTGGILAMATLPDYNNNLFSKAISGEEYARLTLDPTQPLFNRAIRGTYPPGSIVKIVMAAAGLSEGVINVGTAFDTPAAIEIGEYSFPDWKDHGTTNVERAIAESNNIFFYAIGGGFERIRGIGIDRIKQYWQLFGLGQPTGVDLPGEASGLLPDEDWKKKVRGEPWYIGDTYHVSIGQGDLLVTPLQMLRATAVVANGGKLIKPQLVKKISNAEGEVVKEFEPKILRENFVSKSVIETVQRGMRMAVTEGSARALNELSVTSAGKTGTAQFLNNQKTHAWFEAYAPYENPEVAVIVMIEGGGGGNETAVPVAKELLKYYFSR